MTQDRGAFVVKKAEKLLPKAARDRMTDKTESTAGQLLGVAYGTSFGVGYAGMRGLTGSAVGDGILLGLGVWAGSYLGLLPALGLLSPATQHPPRRTAVMIAAHVVWGSALGIFTELLRKGNEGDGLRFLGAQPEAGEFADGHA